MLGDARIFIPCFVCIACSTGGGSTQLVDATPPEVDAGRAPDPGSDGGEPCRQRCSDGSCCNDGECVGGRCLPTCDGARCGEGDSLCCASGDLCVGGACVPRGPACDSHADCPETMVCEPIVGACVPLPGDAECTFIPEPGVFDPVVEWETRDRRATSLPLVIRMGDDDGDGAIDPGDVPDVVVATFNGRELTSLREPVSTGRLDVLSGDDGRLLARSPDSHPVVPWSVPAAADIDGDGRPEVFMVIATQRNYNFLERCDDDSDCREGRYCVDVEGDTTWTVCGTRTPSVVYDTPLGLRLAAFGYDAATGNPIGRVLWVGERNIATPNATVVVADVDGNGSPEVFAHTTLYDARTGAVLWNAAALAPWTPAPPDATRFHPAEYADVPVIADVDGDDAQEIMRSGVMIESTGRIRWRSSAVPRGHVAVGDFLSATPGPELFVVDGYRMAILDPSTGVPIVGPVQYESGEEPGDVENDERMAGPPVVADFDDDGDVEVAVVGHRRFVIFDPDDEPAPHVRWAREASTDFGSVACSAFDFDADGRTEIVSMSEGSVSILRAALGTSVIDVLWTAAVENDTVWQYPLVADVDADSNAEVIVTHIDGVRVYRDRSDHWVPARPLWNQHAYYFGNVGEAGDVPAVPERNWESHGTFRVNKVADLRTIFLAPDLAIVAIRSDTRGCPSAMRVEVRVQNRGGIGAPSGIGVELVAGNPGGGGAVLGRGATDRALLSGEAVWVPIDVTGGFGDESVLPVHAVVDRSLEAPAGEHSECREDNNVSEPVDLVCPELF